MPKKGYKQTKEHRENSRQNILRRRSSGEKFGFQKGNKIRVGLKHAKNTKKKMRKLAMGRIFTEETKEKLRQATLNAYDRGVEGMGFQRIEGIERIYPEEWNERLKESIRQRDNYTCQECGLHQDELEGRFKKLDVHHIDYDKDNLDPKNLITLCKGCHVKTNYNREYWIEYFQNNL